MQVLVIILSDTEYTESIIDLLRESGIRGATLIDGLGSKAANNRRLSNKSFLSSVIESLEQGAEAKKILISVVEKDSQVETAVEKINGLVGNNHKKKNSTFMFTLPIKYMRGGELERHIQRRDGHDLGKDSK